MSAHANLRQQFPDMGASVFQDVLRAVEGNEEKAKEMLKGMETQAEREEEERKARKIRELQCQEVFRPLTQDEIVRVLEENGWDVDAAIVPLFALLEEKQQANRQRQQEERRRQAEIQRQERRAAARRKAELELKELFAQVPQEQIQQLLEENDGDMDATIEKLSALNRAQEEATKKNQEQLEQKLTTERLLERFYEYATEKEVIQCLEQNKWDIKAASTQLLQLTEDRKKKQILQNFKSFTEAEIEQVLSQNDWKIPETMARLHQLRAERRRKTDEEAQQRIQQKIKQEVDEISRESERLQKELQEKLSLQQQEHEDDKNKKFMQRSVLLAKQIEEEITQDKKDQSADTIFRQELEAKLRVFGPGELPSGGMVPFSRKLIDEMKRKAEAEQQQQLPPPVFQESQTVDASKMAALPPLPAASASTSASDSADRQLFTLTVSTTRADLGHTITVNWSTEQGDTTTSDYIGMYKADRSEQITYEWVRNSPAKQGAVTFSAAKYGRFNFRYFSYSRGKICGCSAAVDIGPEMLLTATSVPNSPQRYAVKFQQLSGNQYPSAWIGLYEKGQLNNNLYISTQWVAHAHNNTLEFEVPKTGEWEFRFFPQRTFIGSYIDVSRCNIVVEGNDSITLEHLEDQKQILVKCKVLTLDPYQDGAWVGVYFVDETNPRMWRRYKYIYTPSAEISFKAPLHTGTYEARLFCHKSNDRVICRSAPIKIDGI